MLVNQNELRKIQGNKQRADDSEPSKDTFAGNIIYTLVIYQSANDIRIVIVRMIGNQKKKKNSRISKK